MKKNNAPVFLLFILLVLFSASCKKDSNASDGSYVKLKVNGDWITYPGLGELGPDLGNDAYTDLGVSAYSKDQKYTFDISIQITGSDFKTGTYSSDTYPDAYVVLDYTYNPDINTLKNYRIDDAPGHEPSKYQIRITDITPTRIKGTFTGNYLYDSFHSDDPDGGVMNITEGAFQVKRIR